MDKNCKYKCQIFTPVENVEELLDWAEYKKDIYGKKVIENSCGDGQILRRIVERYIEDSLRQNKNITEIKSGLENDIYGIELDPKHYKKCKENLNTIANKYNINKVKWHLYCEDSLKQNFEFKFDYVIGNPPYINYRDLDEKTRKYTKENFKVCEKGKFDYCYAFIEKGIVSLKEHGRMAYLIPGSIFKNVFSQELRQYMLPHILEIHDYDNRKLFNKKNSNQNRNILTSSAVIIIEKNSNSKSIKYVNEYNKIEKNIYKKNLNGKWIFSNNKNNSKNKRFGDFFKASNSVATLLNSVFVINDYTEDTNYIKKGEMSIEKGILKKAVSPRSLNNKISKMIIFPYKYDQQNIIMRYEENKLKNLYPNAYKYLMLNKKDLDNRKSDTSAKWYEYGRSQALNDMNREKLLLSIVVTKKVKVYELDKDTIPYSGIYIIPKKDKTLKEAKEILESKEFFEYVKNVGINASGESIRITSSDINNYMF